MVIVICAGFGLVVIGYYLGLICVFGFAGGLLAFYLPPVILGIVLNWFLYLVWMGLVCWLFV